MNTAAVCRREENRAGNVAAPGLADGNESLGAGEGAEAQIKTGQEGMSCLWNEI